MKSNNTLVDDLYDYFEEVYVISDADHPSKIMEAVHKPYAIANNMF
ncbi:hypothetical protein [Alkalibaculum bacchi]|nr:hypothetical protein [Alkalibaculum bacchi]